MKIGIVGSGNVGSAAAYSVLVKNAAQKIVLIDADRSRAEAQAEDISHAAPYTHPVEVDAGDYRDLGGASMVVITAGVNQKPGETRLALVERNAKIIRQIVPQIAEWAPEALVLMTTNPVDVMTQLASTVFTGAVGKKDRVIGTGTVLDTARFRELLGRRLGVDPQHVHGYVVGEHGDSEVLAWSLVSIGGLSLEAFARARGVDFTDGDRTRIGENVRGAAYRIIRGKGATSFGIGAAIAHIVDAVAHEKETIATLCRPLDRIAGVADTTVSLPHLIRGRDEIVTLPLSLSREESDALAHSARVIRDTIDRIA